MSEHSDRRKITAKAPDALKKRIRVAMGWPDRRSWTPAEWAEVKERYTITIDYLQGVYCAARKEQPHD